MTAQTLTVHPVPSMGAEDVLVAPDGTVLTGTEDGAIWALDPATGNTRRVADTGGRPLGIELLPENPEFEVIRVPEGDPEFAIEGLAVGLIRNGASF